MRHARFKFVVAGEIVEVDHYELGPDELDELPGDRQDYCIVQSDESVLACKITGLNELLQTNPLRFIGGRGN
jgi:hypothetical protein